MSLIVPDEEMASSILACGLLHSVKVANKQDLSSPNPYTRVLSDAAAAEFKGWCEENMAELVHNKGAIVNKFWNLVGVSARDAPQVLIHIDEVQAHTHVAGDMEESITNLRKFWAALHHTKKIQYYMSSKSEDLSRIKESRKPVSPTKLQPLWLGPLDQHDISVIMKDRFKHKSFKRDEIEPAAKRLHEITSGVPRFVRRVLWRAVQEHDPIASISNLTNISRYLNGDVLVLFKQWQRSEAVRGYLTLI